MIESPFHRYQTLSFDCYGTLIDWETGITTALGPWAERHGLTNENLLGRFSQVEAVVQAESPELRYPLVLAESLRRIGDATDAEAEAFGDSIGDWPAFPDSADALKRLQERYQLVILSNIDRASFALSQPQLGVEFDLVLTAEEIGSYKPDPRNFQYLFDHLPQIESDRSRLLHVAQSLFHDHVPAQKLGLKTVFIDRQGKPGGATPIPVGVVTPTWIYPTMAAFAEAADG